MPLLGLADEIETPDGHLGTSGQERLQGGQGQVGGPQVPLLGHGDEIETPN